MASPPEEKIAFGIDVPRLHDIIDGLHEAAHDSRLFPQEVDYHREERQDGFTFHTLTLRYAIKLPE